MASVFAMCMTTVSPPHIAYAADDTVAVEEMVVTDLVETETSSDEEMPQEVKNGDEIQKEDELSEEKSSEDRNDAVGDEGSLQSHITEKEANEEKSSEECESEEQTEEFGSVEGVSAETEEMTSTEADETATEESSDEKLQTTMEVDETEADSTEDSEPGVIKIKEEATEAGKSIVPTFDKTYPGVSTAGLDFSSKELLIGTSDSSIFTADTEVISELNGVYLTRYKTIEETKNAYTYYYNKADLIEPNSVIVKVADEDDVDHGEAEFSDINTGNDALSKVDDINISARGMIALIDTGAAGAAKSVSVLNNLIDDNGHGTRMANIIKQVDPSAQILSIKALDSTGKGKAADIYAAIELAIESKVSVINLSISAISTQSNDVIREAVNDALRAGIKVVAAAGNAGKSASYYMPGNISGVITVGAADEQGKRRTSSNYGDCVDCYVSAASTSEASAYVAGLLYKHSLDEILSRDDIYDRDYAETSKEVGCDNEGWMEYDPDGNFTTATYEQYKATHDYVAANWSDTALRNALREYAKAHKDEGDITWSTANGTLFVEFYRGYRKPSKDYTEWTTPSIYIRYLFLKVWGFATYDADHPAIIELECQHHGDNGFDSLDNYEISIVLDQTTVVFILCIGGRDYWTY